MQSSREKVFQIEGTASGKVGVLGVFERQEASMAAAE